MILTKILGTFISTFGKRRSDVITVIFVTGSNIGNPRVALLYRRDPKFKDLNDTFYSEVNF